MSTKIISSGILVVAILSGCATQKSSVVINGVKWATRNVDMPATFVAYPTDPGMFYQWNRNTGWSSADPRKAYGADGEIPDLKWNYSAASGDEWEEENDPCPKGWRIPDRSDFEKLNDVRNVIGKWVEKTETTPEGQYFTDKKSGKVIFFPDVDSRHGTGRLYNFQPGAIYWSATENEDGQYDFTHAYVLYFFRNEVRTDISIPLTSAHNLRCVKGKRRENYHLK